MSVTAEALRELHRIHRQISDLKARLTRGPRQIAASEANVNRLTQVHEEAKNLLKSSKMACDEKNLQLRQREDRLVDLKGKLNTAGSNKEFQAIKEQIAADEQANSVLSDEILEALERIDELQVQLARTDDELKRGRADLEKVTARVESERAGLESELARVSESLNAAESALPSDMRSDYERMAKAKGEEALAQVDQGSCGGCYQLLSPQTLNELSMGKLVFCKSCGALLYLPEDRSPAG